MGNHADLIDHVFHIVRDPVRFQFGIQSTLQLLVVSGDAGGADVVIALQCLGAAQAEHESPRGNDEVRAHAQCPGHIRGVDEFA